MTEMATANEIASSVSSCAYSVTCANGRRALLTGIISKGMNARTYERRDLATDYTTGTVCTREGGYSYTQYADVSWSRPPYILKIFI